MVMDLINWEITQWSKRKIKFLLKIILKKSDEKKFDVTKHLYLKLNRCYSYFLVLIKVTNHV